MERYSQLYRDVEASLINENERSWDQILSQVITENVCLGCGFDYATWLVKARRGGKTDTAPYVDGEIGMNRRKNFAGYNRGNRWGEMFYLSTDLTAHSAFYEIGLNAGESATAGYFFVNESLQLFRAADPFVIADNTKDYEGYDALEVSFVLMALIKKWFNTPYNTENLKTDAASDLVYRVTNNIARIVREKTKLDGIIYQCTKNPNPKKKSWNIALVDDRKLSWGYSVLMVPDSIGRYRKKTVQKSNEYAEMLEKTQYILKQNRKKDYPPEMRSIFEHAFPA